MRFKRPFIAVCVLLLVVIIGILSWSFKQASLAEQTKVNRAESIGPESFTRTDNQGAVSVEATWLNPLNSTDQFIEFQLAFNTHSVNLNEYQLKEKAGFLINGQNVTNFEIETRGSGHHVTTVLKVPLKELTIKANKIKTVKLTLKDLDNVPQRVFVWQL